MIEWYQAVVLALMQGLTEFLPISSSAHLVIPSLLLGWPDQGLAFDVAVHVGTLTAVLLYYRQDLALMAGSWLRSLTGGPASQESRLVWYLALATVPAGLVGLIGGDFIESNLRTLPVIASTTLVFGILLGVADKFAPSVGQGKGVNLIMAMMIGLAQGLAPFNAAVCGAYLHGLAGEIIAEQIGTAGMLARDLLPALPLAIDRLTL